MDINSIKPVVKKALLSEKFLIKMAALVILLLLLKRSILSLNDVKEFNTGVEDFSAQGLLKYMKNNLVKKEADPSARAESADHGGENPVLNASTGTPANQDAGDAKALSHSKFADVFLTHPAALGSEVTKGTHTINLSEGTTRGFGLNYKGSFGTSSALTSTPSGTSDNEHLAAPGASGKMTVKLSGEMTTVSGMYGTEFSASKEGATGDGAMAYSGNGTITFIKKTTTDDQGNEEAESSVSGFGSKRDITIGDGSEITSTQGAVAFADGGGAITSNSSQEIITKDDMSVSGSDSTFQSAFAQTY